MLRQVSVFGILACGMTLVIIAGGIDLAVGSILGLCAVLFSLFSIHGGMASGSWRRASRLRQGLRAGTVVGRSDRPIPHAAVHRHARHDGLRARAGEAGLGRAEDLHRGPAGRRRYQYVDVPGIFDVAQLHGSPATISPSSRSC